VTSIHQLKVTLQGFKPFIWRRIQVDSHAPLNEVHMAIQIAMGWTDSHLHDFTVNGQTYAARTPYGGLDGAEDETKHTLIEIAPTPKAKIGYLYDFGDSWEHVIMVEKVLTPDPEAVYPRCIAGKNACPPDDCGGVWGYANLLEALHNPNHPEHEELLEWAGEVIDPEAFDLDATNRKMADLPDFFRTGKIPMSWREPFVILSPSS